MGATICGGSCDTPRAAMMLAIGYSQAVFTTVRRWRLLLMDILSVGGWRISSVLQQRCVIAEEAHDALLLVELLGHGLLLYGALRRPACLYGGVPYGCSMECRLLSRPSGDRLCGLYSMGSLRSPQRPIPTGRRFSMRSRRLCRARIVRVIMRRGGGARPSVRVRPMESGGGCLISTIP